MISPGCCGMPPVQRPSSFSVSRNGIPFVIIDRYTTLSYVCPKPEVMLVFLMAYIKGKDGTCSQKGNGIGNNLNAREM